MGRAHWVLAAAVYLAVGVFAYRVVLPNPRFTLPYSAHLSGMNLLVDQADQQFVVASIAQGARSLTRTPAALWDNHQCFPLARPVTLGEHMLGEALLGAVPARLVNEPIAIYNAVLVLGLAIAGLSMYALVRGWTGSTGAALVAGLLFAIQPGRIGDPTHPFVHGDLWSPLVLLATHRLFVRRTWTAALGLALATCLVLLESLYAVLALVLIATVYVPYLLVKQRAHLGELAPKLALAATLAAGMAAFVFLPYLETRDAWNVLEGRPGLHLPIELLLPGTFYYPGTVVLVLAAVALLDRVRGTRIDANGYDPRLVFAVAAALITWCFVWVVPVPGTGWAVPSPLPWVREWLPGLAAVRAVPAIRTGMYLSLTFLAGYGLWLLVRARGIVWRTVVVTLALAAGAIETFHPDVGRVSLGVTPVPMGVRRAAPYPAVRRLAAALPDGAVLDLPFRLDPVWRIGPMAHYVFLGAYHGRPVAACYNSFTVPIMEQTAALAARVPEAAALAALHALGYRSIVIHDELMAPPEAAALRAAMTRAGAGPVQLVPLGDFQVHRAFRLDGTQGVTTGFAALGPVAAPAAQTAAAGVDVPVQFRFRNVAGETFRHPDPITPRDVVVRWRAQPSGRTITATARLLLPIALAPGAESEEVVELRAPDAAGRYEVDLTLPDAPAAPLARAVVEVGA